MNTLRKLYLKLPSLYSKDNILKRSITSAPNLIAEPLIERSLLKVQGNEVSPFLQGLITNDMGHLKCGSNSLFAMFLNNAGRVLYDTIVYRTGDENVFLLECDKTICSELKKHLKMYRVRRKIEIESLGSQYQPWVVFSAHKLQNDAEKRLQDSVEDEITMTTTTANFDTKEIIACQDPRVKALGVRLILPKSISYPEISELFSNDLITKPTENLNYKYLRYSLGVGEGVEEHIPNKSFPLEVNCDFLHGVSFHKGCYIGQELTARVHHTGVIRKRLMPLKLTKKIEESVVNVQTVGGMVVGALRASTRDIALALIRVEQALKFPDLFIDGDPCKLIVPEWWPKESPNKYTIKEKQLENT